ncbi:ABC transporter substrate-binding protein [Williamsia soli]|uniref:ABC transporter substrate-binding protein n=1 Tax=Williamsia soli TaxID=364929 RepID=UPI001A9DB834|nr:ABC transporter substrate-binding protein [Williamsia soli]
MRRNTGRLLAGAIAVACALSVVSCSSDSDDGGGSASQTVATEGGTKASGDPIKVGLFNPSKGPLAQPGVAVGQKAAVTYINEQIGGIGGRPIEVVDCGIDQTSPESTIACANQFVEAGVVAAIDGNDVEAAAAMPILTSAGIPMIGQTPYNAAVGAETENRVYFGPPPAAFLVGFLQSLKEEGKDSVTMGNADVPQAHLIYDSLMVPLTAQFGIETKNVYYPPAGPNFTALATTLSEGAPAAAGVMNVQNDNFCTKLAQSMRSVKYKGTLFLANCTEFIDSMGAQAVGARTYSPNWLPPAIESAPEATQKNMAIAEQFIDEAGGEAGYHSLGMFATFVDFAQGLNSLQQKDFTGPAIVSALKGLTNYQSFLGPVLDCTSPTSPNCTSEVLLFDVVADKKTEPFGGGFTQPDPAVLKLIPGAV